MHSRSSFVLALGFGTLVVLIAVMGLGAIRRAAAIYHEMEVAQDTYLEAENFRRDIARDMYRAEILIRDYLLDPSPHNAPIHREELRQIRASLQERLDSLAVRTGQANNAGMQRLQEEVQGYWDSLDPIFEWTQQDKAERSWMFLRRNVFPRRSAVVDLAREMANLSKENLERERQRIRNSQQVFHGFLVKMMVFALSFGSLVALLTIYRVSVLEHRHDEQRKRIEETENNLRRLSRRLVQTQEVERKSLSRELHDEVGQTLTALGIELANLDAVRTSDAESFHQRLEDAKQLNSGAMRALRDLAMGLRPSMLDDLGLQPALEWQGREFSRHTGVPATVEVQGSLDHLSEAESTCIYRVVQEALTNCARHARARNVLVSVQAQNGLVNVVVRDDGIGFVPGPRSRTGLGLLGIEERVQALDGRVSIVSRPNQGTTVRAEIPVKGAVTA